MSSNSEYWETLSDSELKKITGIINWVINFSEIEDPDTGTHRYIPKDKTGVFPMLFTLCSSRTVGVQECKTVKDPIPELAPQFAYRRDLDFGQLPTLDLKEINALTEFDVRYYLLAYFTIILPLNGIMLPDDDADMALYIKEFMTHYNASIDAGGTIHDIYSRATDKSNRFSIVCKENFVNKAIAGNEDHPLFYQFVCIHFNY